MALPSGFQLNPKYGLQMVNGQAVSLPKQRTNSGPQPIDYLGASQPSYAPVPQPQNNALAMGATMAAPQWTTAFEGWQPRAMPQPVYGGGNALAAGFRGYEGPAQVNPFSRSYLPSAAEQRMPVLQNSWFGDRNQNNRGGNDWSPWQTYRPGSR